MLKQPVAVVFLLSFLVQSFTSTVIIGDYYVNTRSYAQNCINKAKPMLHCNGKCQMLKKLKQEEKKDQQNPQRRSSKENTLSSKSFFAVIGERFYNPSTSYQFYRVAIPADRAISFFHPPGEAPLLS